MAPDEEMPDADDEPREPTPIEQPPPFKPAELKEEVSVQGGRRRGKRQVMKKKTVKDEEGYLGPCIMLGPHRLPICTNLMQSLGKRRHGNLSPKMSRCLKRSQSMFPKPRLAKLQDRAISCLSLGRNEICSIIELFKDHRAQMSNNVVTHLVPSSISAHSQRGNIVVLIFSAFRVEKSSDIGLGTMSPHSLGVLLRRN